MRKYWNQRYDLFSRFDHGIQIDRDGLFSVTSEQIAKHHADRFRGRAKVVDMFGGVGGNCVHLASSGCSVTAFELDRGRARMVKNNCAVYGVNVNVVHGDAVEGLENMRKCGEVVDGTFVDPPWGGMDYIENERFDIHKLQWYVAVARSICADVAVKVPRNTDDRQMLEVLGDCEVEYNYLNGRLKMKTLYFGRLGTTSVVGSESRVTNQYAQTNKRNV